ncbi:hypothetical protein [Thiolapillus sp.]
MQDIDLEGVMKTRSHTHRPGEIFHIARRIKSLCYAPPSIADLGVIDWLYIWFPDSLFKVWQEIFREAYQTIPVAGIPTPKISM